MARSLISSDASVRSFRSGAPEDSRSIRRLNDGDGLYLLDGPPGSRGWRFDFRFEGKNKTISLGNYPAVTLAAARRAAEEARSKVAAGINPSDVRKKAKATVALTAENERLAAAGESPVGSFEFVANEFIVKRSTPQVDGRTGAQKPPRWSAGYTDGWHGRLRRHVYPWIGARPITELGPIHLLEVLRKIEDRGTTDTVQKVYQMLGEVMRYAVACQYIASDPSRDLRGALTPHTKVHLPTITDANHVGQLVRDIRRYRGTATIRAAMQFALLVFQRTHMLREMKWEHVDLEKRLWTIPSALMKRKVGEKLNGQPHLVPLSRQALEILRTQATLTATRGWVFPGTNNRSGFSEGTINKALASMGYKDHLTGHGFRAMARTMMGELDVTLGEVLEAQLAHKKRGALGGSYDRAEYVAMRCDVMQRWADYLDKLAA